jgi:hypothetical protein
MSEFTTFDMGETINGGQAPDLGGSVVPIAPETFFSHAWGPKKNEEEDNRGRGGESGGGKTEDWRDKHRRSDGGTDSGQYDPGVKRSPEGDEYEDLGYGHVG